MKKHQAMVASVLILCTGSVVHAQTASEPRIITCDTTVVQQSPLTVQDEASHKGAIVENPNLISLANGMKAVQFSVRHARSPDPYQNILKVRYTVHWTDLCGRSIKAGSNSVNGLALDPKRQEVLQSTAPHRDAAHAALRIYTID